MSRKQVVLSAVAVAVALLCMGGVAWLKWPRAGARGAGLSRAEIYRPTPFEILAVPYSPPPRQLEGAPGSARPDPFPPHVRALNEKKISVVGYMAPLSMNAGRIDSFFLSRGVFRCCFADAPRMTDYIRVTMAPGCFAPNADVVQVSGVFEVGEERNSLGYVESVYHMTADTVSREDVEASGWAEAAAWGVGGLFFLALFGPACSRLIKTVRERHRLTPAGIE